MEKPFLLRRHVFLFRQLFFQLFFVFCIRKNGLFDFRLQCLDLLFFFGYVRICGFCAVFQLLQFFLQLCQLCIGALDIFPDKPGLLAEPGLFHADLRQGVPGVLFGLFMLPKLLLRGQCFLLQLLFFCGHFGKFSIRLAALG